MSSVEIALRSLLFFEVYLISELRPLPARVVLFGDAVEGLVASPTAAELLLVRLHTEDQHGGPRRECSHGN